MYFVGTDNSFTKKQLFFIPHHTIVAGYYGVTLAVRLSVRLFVLLYARYILRLTFVLMSVYSVILGLKIGVVGLKRVLWG